MIRLAHTLFGSLAVLLLFVLPMNSRDGTSPSTKTQYSGNNSFSCFSEDIPIEETTSIKVEIRHTPELFVLNLRLDSLGDRITFVLKEAEIKETTYELDHPDKRYVTFQYQGESCTYSADELHGGHLMIHHYNPTKKIIAGSFEFMAYANSCNTLIRINNGLFDAPFIDL
jgi:hypothetical protein